MHLLINIVGECMYEFREKLKRDVGDGDQFIELSALIFLKLLENVTIIHMHLHMKQLYQWMHGF